MAGGLLSKYGQGGAVYHIVDEPAPQSKPWEPQSAEVVTRISAVKASGRRFQEYQSRGLITQGDLLLAASGFHDDPKPGDGVRVDGERYQVVMADPATLPGSPAIIWMIGARR